MIPSIFVISHQRANARREEMRRQLEELNFQFSDAIFPKELHVPFEARIRDALADHSLSMAEFGCILSHRRLWKKFLSTPDEWVVVFEDDISLQRDRFRAACKSLSIISGDIVFFGAHDGLVQPKLSTLRWLKQVGFVGDPVEKTLYCSYAYAVSRGGAKKLLWATRTLASPLDYWADHIESVGLEVKCFFPMIASPNLFAYESTIQSVKEIPSSWRKISVFVLTLFRQLMSRIF